MEHTDNRPRLSDLAQEQILCRIRSGELPVGSRLPSEPELAQQMGISRGILREALNSLQTRGYITRTPRGGSHITRPEASALSENLMKGFMNASLGELIDYREALESYAATLVITRASDDDIAHLRDLAVFESQHSVVDSRDFHYRLAELSEVRQIPQFIDFYFERIQALADDSHPAQRPKFIFKDLEHILHSLETRNLNTMRTAMRRLFRHIRQHYHID